jgi:endonuclease/exonuclease/phosphatase family metal-dependent hydrolase
MSTFRVLQFNMQFAQGWASEEPHHGEIDLEATLAEIRSHDADLIFLQEVERALANGSQLNPPPNYTRLRAELDHPYGCFAYPKADERELPFGVGLAILSRTPLHDEMRLNLPSPGIAFEFDGRKTTPTDRLLLGTKTTIQGREVLLLNAHLLAFFMLGTSSSVHPQQREMIAGQLAASHRPTLLAGDFNVRRHGDLMAQYASHGYRTVQDQQVTWRRQPYVLDHIFYNDAFRVVSHSVKPTLASDHHALVADLEFV